jgi:MFS family permease
MGRTTIHAPLPAPPYHDQRRGPHRLLRFDLLVRVAILFAATITCLLAWFVPVSLTATLLIEGGAVGQAVLLAMTAATAIGYVDVVINDLMPDRFCVRLIKHKRHLGYSLIAFLYLVQAYASIGESLGPEDLLPLGYIMNGLMAAWFSWTSAVRGWHV